MQNLIHKPHRTQNGVPRTATVVIELSSLSKMVGCVYKLSCSICPNDCCQCWWILTWRLLSTIPDRNVTTVKIDWGVWSIYTMSPPIHQPQPLVADLGGKYHTGSALYCFFRGSNNFILISTFPLIFAQVLSCFYRVEGQKHLLLRSFFVLTISCVYLRIRSNVWAHLIVM